MDGGEPQEPWFCDGKTTILPQVKTRAKKVATTTEVMIANCLGCNPCVSTPKMIFSLRREVKSSDFMRVSVMLPFSFSRTFQKRYGKLCGPFRGEEREDSKPLPHPVLRRTLRFTSFSVESAWGCWVRRKSSSVWMRRFTEEAIASTRSWSMNSSAPVNVSRISWSMPSSLARSSQSKEVSSRRGSQL